MPQRYLITTPTSAVAITSGARQIIEVPNDSVVDVSVPLDGLQGLIEVTVNGEAALMFAEDIRQRGKAVFRRSA